MLLCCLALPAGRAQAASRAGSFEAYGAEAIATLQRTWYSGGLWRTCLLQRCHRTNRDWGADSLTAVLYLRWRITRDPGLERYFATLTQSAPRYTRACRDERCRQWSDVPAWDAVAALQEYEATRSRAALTKAKAAYDFVVRSSRYAAGACPSILYQQPDGRENRLKTLESDANIIKAGLLLYRFTNDRRYLENALARYTAVRRYHLDPLVPLYSVYVFDDGKRCEQLPHRFFASVNGLMIDAGINLYALTGDQAYWTQALATAKAVDDDLADGRGIFVDLQAENDIVEPLVEAMWELAVRGSQRFARAWLLRNAEAAVSARTAEGYGRFFDGPPPAGPITAWQTNGGFALMVAAADLAPDTIPKVESWHDAASFSSNIEALPATIRFTGSAIALIGTIGERCCERGRAVVVLDEHETFDHTGIWQNKSSANMPLHGSILFAWRWPSSGAHILQLGPVSPNSKEGGTFVHLRGYLVK